MQGCCKVSARVTIGTIDPNVQTNPEAHTRVPLKVPLRVPSRVPLKEFEKLIDL